MRTAIHIFQRTEGHVVLFYTKSDLLCFYTILSICAKKTGIKVLAVAEMYDHIHILVEAASRGEVTAFVQMYSSLYAQEHNRDSGLSGKVFESPFGTSLKRGDKEIRTCAGYIYNNHTNKKLCSRAEEIRWNFLAYAHSSNPFSAPIKRAIASKKMRAAIAIVDSEHKASHPLNHPTLRRLFSGLSKLESEQLTDYIIDAYRFIDYNSIESLYRSYDEMLYSFNANTFNDYDIHEDYQERSGDDTVFREMAKYITSLKVYRNLKDILSAPDNRMMELATELRVMTRATWRQIGAYLHIKLGSSEQEHIDGSPAGSDFVLA